MNKCLSSMQLRKVQTGFSSEAFMWNSVQFSNICNHDSFITVDSNYVVKYNISIKTKSLNS
jgi:hypothetical protein